MTAPPPDKRAAEEFVPRVLACNQARGFKIVKRSEPCPWCGRAWDDHPETAELERYFRTEDGALLTPGIRGRT